MGDSDGDQVTIKFIKDGATQRPLDTYIDEAVSIPETIPISKKEAVEREGLII